MLSASASVLFLIFMGMTMMPWFGTTVGMSFASLTIDSPGRLIPV
jgi:hypothetical protein